MSYGHDGPGTRMSRREALARATYGVGGLLLFRGPRTGLSTAGQPVSRTAAAGAGRSAGPPAHDAVRLPGAAQPRAVCNGRSGLVVVGVTEDGDPVSWYSPDGRRWTTRLLPPPAAGEADVWGVAAHGERYLAVGSLLQQHTARVRLDPTAAARPDDVTFTAARRAPAVWWTGDGVDWVGQTIDAAGVEHAQLISVSCSGTRLVAVGSTLDADGVQGDGGLVLASDDGTSWWRGRLSTAGGALPEGSLTGVAAAGDTWYATSSDMAGGAVWSSADAAAWSVIPSSRRHFAGMTLQGIGVRGGRVVVAATSLADHSTHYHVSTDGCRTWRALRRRVRADDRLATTVTNLTVIDGEIVVVGTRGRTPIIDGGITDVRN